MSELTEEQLIERVAQLWVDNGGDKDGIYWCLSKIADKVQELIDESD